MDGLSGEVVSAVGRDGGAISLLLLAAVVGLLGVIGLVVRAYIKLQASRIEEARADRALVETLKTTLQSMDERLKHQPTPAQTIKDALDLLERRDRRER